MTRDLTSAQQTATEAETGTTIYLLELTYYDDGTASESRVRFAMAGEDVVADPDGTGDVTFEGIGGWLEWGGVSETSNMRAQGTELALSGVDQTIITQILSKQFRGRRARIWRVDVDESDGSLDLWDPWAFLQLEDYEVDEGWGDHENPGTVRITTRVTSPLAVIRRAKAVRTNDASLAEMHARAGLATGDTGFQNVAGLAGKRIFWGTEAPDEATSGGGSGSPGGGDGTPGGEPSSPKPPFLPGAR